MSEPASPRVPTEPPSASPVTIHPWLIGLFLSCAWVLVILLTVKLIILYDRSPILSSNEPMIDQSTIDAIQARVGSGLSKEAL